MFPNQNEKSSEILQEQTRELTDVARVNEIFSEAYACINQGLCYDEVDDYENTLAMYDRGLNLILEAQKEECAKKCELYEHLLEAKGSVENRIKMMKKDGPKSPPSLDKQTDEIPLNKVKELEELKLEIHQKDEIREKLDSVGDKEAELIYFLPGGVQLFTIEGEKTTAPTFPSSLEILCLNTPMHTSIDEGNTPEAFIQVGSWVYPLTKGCTPILKNEYGAYVVLNPTPDHPTMMVAIMLPSDIEQKLKEEFEYVLLVYADLRENEVKEQLTTEERKRISDRIARLLVKTGESIAWGLHSTQTKVSSKIEDKNQKMRSSMKPAERPMNISPAIKSSVLYMHKGSKVVAKCTRFLLDKVGDMGMAVGRSLTAGAKDTFGQGKSGGVLTDTITVLGCGIVSISTVWMALEDASKNLCKSIANQTVENVKLKYGDQAAETTHHFLYAGGHTSLAATQLWDLGPRSIAGRITRKAGLQVVGELYRKKTGEDLRLGERREIRRKKEDTKGVEEVVSILTSKNKE